MGRCWSQKNSNIHVEQQQVYQGYRAVIASCSDESGIELTHTYSHAITSKEFIKYLRWLKKKNSRPVALFMDQLAVHKSA
jgi:hypothetical protein